MTHPVTPGHLLLAIQALNTGAYHLLTNTVITRTCMEILDKVVTELHSLVLDF